MYTSQLIAYYLQNQNKLSLKIGFWTLVFVFLLWSNQYFWMGLFKSTNLISNFFSIVQIIGIHYLFKRILYPNIKKGQWLVTLVAIVPLYMISNLLITITLYVNIYLYPGDPLAIRLFDKYAIKALSDFLNLYTLLWFITTAFSYNLLSIIGTIGIDLFRMQQTRFAVLEARDEMEISFLRAQIEPHFLFNTLNNIYGLLINQSKQSEAMLTLSEIMRYSLYESRLAKTPLSNEMAYIRHFLTLEKARLQKNNLLLDFNLRTDQAECLVISPLFLSQFLEESLEKWAECVNNARVSIAIEASAEMVQLIMEYHPADRLPDAIYPSELWFRRAKLEYRSLYAIQFYQEEDFHRVDLTIHLSYDTKKSKRRLP